MHVVRKAVAVVVVMLAATLMVHANLLTNPGFEDGLNGWTEGSGSWYTQGGADAHSGSLGGCNEMLVGVGADQWRILDQRVSVTAGESYTASAWMRYAGTANNSEQFLEIQWVNASDNIMWVDPYASTHVTGPQDYTQYILSDCVAPVGAVKADVRAIVHTTALTSGGTAWHAFDDFSFASNAVIPEPTTLAFLGLGIGMAAILRKRLTH